ncbi:hypothetical protein NE237_010571 [Protea cynaroides]|uniref:BTB domain-containing protein n=1 Tax=Protea cynaroides TaxID=273540 RepID=A0A9Q0L0W0_9MAGN|nr:hypothetical protein NE237_010571 [Protea cynaroides]
MIRQRTGVIKSFSWLCCHCFFLTTMSSGFDSFVRLNIGGKKFCTTVDTLTQREPESMLAAMFSGRHTVSQDPEKGFVFVDRDGKHFRHILNWLRDGVVPTLNDSEYPELLREAEYYQLLGLVEEIHAVSNRRKDDDDVNVKTEVSELTRTDVIKCIQSKKVKFRGVNLSGLDLSKLDLSFVDFSYACLRNVFFSRANIHSAKFRDVEAEGSNFHNAILRECEFTGANLRGALLAGANLQSANLQDACLIDCSFCGADLRSAHLQTADLTNANLEGANLEGANLKGAKLSGANMQGANLQRAYLRHVDLRDTHLEGAKLDGANLLGAIRSFVFFVFLSFALLPMCLEAYANESLRSLRNTAEFATTEDFIFAEILGGDVELSTAEYSGVVRAHNLLGEINTRSVLEVVGMAVSFVTIREIGPSPSPMAHTTDQMADEAEKPMVRLAADKKNSRQCYLIELGFNKKSEGEYSKARDLEEKKSEIAEGKKKAQCNLLLWKISETISTKSEAL